MRLRIFVAILLVASGLAGGDAFAEGSPGAQERAARKYEGCTWTQEMGRFLFECVRQHNGMNAQWCHIEAMETFCGAQTAPPGAADRQTGAR